MVKPELKKVHSPEINGASVLGPQAFVEPGHTASAPAKGGTSRALIILAFAAVYLIWGSTYLAIKYAIDTLPPLVMAATRFLLAGAILFTWANLLGKSADSRSRLSFAHWKGAFIIGGRFCCYAATAE